PPPPDLPPAGGFQEPPPPPRATAGHGTGPKRTGQPPPFLPGQAQPSKRPESAGFCRNPIGFGRKFQSFVLRHPATVSDE
ncbi:unnamed protein product, partial [Prunus brigantina]